MLFSFWKNHRESSLMFQMVNHWHIKIKKASFNAWREKIEIFVLDEKVFTRVISHLVANFRRVNEVKIDR